MERRLLALAGGALLTAWGAGLAWWPRSRAVEAWDGAWAAARSSQVVLDLSPWLPERPTLVDPAMALPRAHLVPPGQVGSLLGPCEARVREAPEGWDKLVTWRRHVCEGDALPEDFHEVAPWMHPEGRSYAALAGRAEAQLRHVRELPAPILDSLADETLIRLVRGASLVLGPRWILTRRPGEAVTYAAVHREVVVAGLRARGFALQAEGCAARRGGDCLHAVPRRGALPLLVGGGVLGVVAVAGLVIEVLRARSRRREDRVFLLRTLTHELRTPAAAIGLQLEPLRRSFDALPAAAQEAFLELSAANQKLQRTLTATATFLSLEGGAPALDVERCDLAALVEVLGVDAEVEPGCTLRTDARWLTLALGNLLANAEQHGAPPVTLTVRRAGEHVRLTVRDHGDLTASLDDLVSPLVRGDHSTGLGLGLALVSRIARLLGGRLELTTSPTSFTLTLPDQP